MIDVRNEAYGTFFKGDFATKAFELSADCESLSRPVFDLIAAWRGASYSAALPSAFVFALKNFHDGYVSPPSSAGMLRYSEVVLELLRREVPNVLSDRKVARSLQEKIAKISQQVIQVEQSTKIEMDPESLWQQYLQLPAFTMGIHATMQQVYLSIFGAYENFCVRLLSIAHSGKRFRVTEQNFKKGLRKAFGDLADEVWFLQEIQGARLIRNALIHAGGRITDELQKTRISVLAHDGHLHVFPEHHLQLFKLLEKPALSLIASERLRNPLPLT